jgi:hypothetical protein
MASPGEFPWACLVLNQKNDFIGSCAIIPSDFSNNNAKARGQLFGSFSREFPVFYCVQEYYALANRMASKISYIQKEVGRERGMESGALSREKAWVY